MTGIEPIADRRLRVLVVIGAYHPEISSGGEQCRTMVRHLREHIDVTVLATAVDRSLPRRDVVEGVPLRRVVVDASRPVSRMRTGYDLLAALTRLVPRVDVVHIHSVSGKNLAVALAALVWRRPLVLSLHTAVDDEPAGIANRGALMRWAFRQARLYLTVSPKLTAAWLTAGLPPDRLREVPNGIDTARFRPSNAQERVALRHRLGIPADRPVIVFVGYFSADKQPHVLFDAWTSLEATHGVETTLVFVGATSSPYWEVDAGLADAVKHQAHARGVADRVVFAGVTPHVEDYLRAADVFALPSRREGLPVALLEAMACGLPCVASRLPGATDAIVDDGVHGLLVPPGDAGALADAMAACLSDPASALTLGARARERVLARYADRAVASAWLEAYQTVTGRGGPTAGPAASDQA